MVALQIKSVIRDRVKIDWRTVQFDRSNEHEGLKNEVIVATAQRHTQLVASVMGPLALFMSSLGSR